MPRRIHFEAWPRKSPEVLQAQRRNPKSLNPKKTLNPVGSKKFMAGTVQLLKEEVFRPLRRVSQGLGPQQRVSKLGLQFAVGFRV